MLHLCALKILVCILSWFSLNCSSTPSPSAAPTRPYGESWTAASSLSDVWNDVGISSSGQYGISSVYDGKLYYSNDYGVSWIQSAGADTKFWNTVGMSASGQYAVAGECYTANGYMYYSKDYGHTWLQSGSLNACYVASAISGTGQYALGGANQNNFLYMSDDYGVTYKKTNLPSSAWQALAIDLTGKYMVAGANAGFIYYSSTFGSTWAASATSPSLQWYSMSMSSNGKYAVAAVVSAAGGGIYYSSDYGQSWTISFSEVRNWRSLSTTASGQFSVAVSNNSTTLYYSSDYGNTWSPGSTGAAGTQGWRRVVLSSDGTYMIGSKIPRGLLYYNAYGLTQTSTPSRSPNAGPVSVFLGQGASSTSTQSYSSVSLFNDLGIFASATLLSPADKVLVLVSLDGYGSVAQKSATYSIFRDSVNLQPTGLQIVETLAVHDSQPSSMSYLDSPGGAGTYSYSIKAKGEVIAGFSSRNLVALMIPAVFTSGAVESTSSLVLSTSTYVDLGMSVTVSTTSVYDTVLVSVNLNIQETTQSIFYVTVTRNGATVLTQSVSMEAVSTRWRQAIGFTFLDMPNSVGSLAYNVQGKY
jgi:hypothetical protein